MKHLLPLLCFLKFGVFFVAGQTPAARLQLAACTSSCTGELGENIYPNGDFGAGIPNVVPVNPGLAPGYIYQPSPPPNDGYYCIANSTANWGWFAFDAWINIEDNGPEPNGYMMVINASYPPGIFFENEVAVCENTLYEFSIDVINLFEDHSPQSIRPNLTFLIDGVEQCETGDIPLDEQWHTIRFSFTTAPGQTTVLLGMRNNAPGGFGNDLAIDNISFRACGPEITSSDTAWFCQAAPAQLEVVLQNPPYAYPVYQWQVLVNGVWQDVPGADSTAIMVPNPQDGDVYRLLIASDAPNLSLSNCRVVSQEIHLMQAPPLSAAAAGSDALCYAASSATASAQAIGGLSPFSYAWSNGANTQTINGILAGQYQVTITDAANCVSTASVTVSEPLLLTAGTGAEEVSCFGATDGAVAASASGGTSPYSFLWSNGATGNTVAGLSAGIYLLTVTDLHGCTLTSSATLATPSLLTAVTSPTSVSCFGGQDAEIQAQANGGIAPYAFEWHNGQTTAFISGVSAGLYAATVTDANGCTSVSTGAVAEPPALQVGVQTGGVSCFGGNNGSLELTVSGGVSPYSYAWPQGQTTAQIGGLGAGNYVATVTDANGCSTPAVGTVPEPQLLLTEPETAPVSCFGGNNGEALLTASGGVPPFSFVWNTGQTTAQINQLIAGTYTATVTDANGCTGVAVASVAEPPVLTGSTTADDVQCFGENNGSLEVAAAGGVLPYTYLWNTGQSTAQIGNLSAGGYTVIITDGNACTTLVSAAIAEPALLSSAGAAADVTCFGGNDGWANATVTGGVVPFSYAWNTGATTAQISQLTAGLYEITASDANGCSTVMSVTVNQPALVEAVASAAPAQCFGGSDGSSVVQSIGGQAPHSYIWSNGQTTATLNGLTAGIYSVTATDAAGCTAVATVEVGEPSLLALAANAETVSCFNGTDGVLSAAPEGGTPPYAVTWSTGQSGPVIQGLPAGLYSLTSTDAQGCTAVAVIALTEPPVLEGAPEIEQVSCFGGNDGQAALTVSGGTPPYAYTWSNGQNGAQISFLTAGNYQVTATDAEGCTHTAVLQVTQPSALTTSVESQPVRCFGQSDGVAAAMAAGGTPPYNYVWQAGQSGAQVSGLAAGWYQLSVTDAPGCMTTTQVFVAEPPPLVLQAQALPASCQDASDGRISVWAEGGIAPYHFIWNNGQTTADLEELLVGAYSVIGTDANGCQAVTEAIVEGELMPAVDLGLDQVVTLGDELVLKAQTNLPANEILDYNWSGVGGTAQCADCDEFRFVPLKSGCERVLVRSVSGCQAADEVCFQVIPRRRIYVPNVFHPNNEDGVNDYFTIYSDASVLRIRYLKIFDRWGEQLFQAVNIPTNEETSGWDGAFRGESANPGVFVWVAEIEFVDGEILVLHGDVTLVR
ncbi:MAG: gliding motility-associated C-terminal domain-containing protein [Saprospiraceae bacterium]|nr:gliding motility-associated C-terminal domain-containing protein [Saprospiraceae bacterium]